MTNSSAEARNDPKKVISWCLYDWANSAFTTLVVTFVYATYFTRYFAPNEDAGTALWSRGIVVSSVLIALASPILGAVADRGGTRRRYLIVATLVCVFATTVLTFVNPGAPNAAVTALTVFVVANVAFEIGIVFYNSFLPALVTPERIGRVSGYGWGLGYFGGLACLTIGLLGFVGLLGEPWLPLSQDDGFNVRATNLLVAAWMLLFSLPIFVFVRDPVKPRERIDLRGALDDLKRTVQQLGRFREVIKFLVARLIYNDGLITVFAFGGIYAAGTFGMTFTEVMVFGIVLNVAAGTGALLFGMVDDKLGGKKTILLSLAALIAAALTAVLAPNRTWLWIGGIAIGIFAGPNQSASRSLMGRFVPARHQSEFFGFFAFSGKATAFLGPLLLGILSGAYGQRAGVSTVILFFIAGGILLMTVNERGGIEAARAADEQVFE